MPLRSWRSSHWTSRSQRPHSPSKRTRLRHTIIRYGAGRKLSTNGMAEARPADAVGSARGPPHEHGAPLDVLDGDEAPIARVVGVVAVVAEDEDRPVRHPDRRHLGRRAGRIAKGGEAGAAEGV